MMARPKSQGGVGILDPITHTNALCAKLFCKLADSKESWACMARSMIEEAKSSSKGGNWKNLSLENKLLAPKGVKLKLGGFTAKIVSKCSKAITTLKWKEEIRYWKNSALHWSPWGPWTGNLELSGHWLEIARNLNNKGIATMHDLWNQHSGDWCTLIELRLSFQFSLQKRCYLVDF